MRTDRVVSEVLGEEIAITPSDLYNAELKTNLFFGYSKNQVDMLLERTADVLEFLITRNKQLKAQTEELKEELEKFRDMEASLRSALISSQKMSENLISSARFQADALIEEAKLARAQAVFKMEQLPDALRTEIRRLSEARDRLRDDIAALLVSHKSLLGDLPRAEDTGGEFIREEVKRHFIALQDDDDEEEDTEEDAADDESADSQASVESGSSDGAGASMDVSSEPSKDPTEDETV